MYDEKDIPILKAKIAIPILQYSISLADSLYHRIRLLSIFSFIIFWELGVFFVTVHLPPTHIKILCKMPKEIAKCRKRRIREFDKIEEKMYNIGERQAKVKR